MVPWTTSSDTAHNSVTVLNDEVLLYRGDGVFFFLVPSGFLRSPTSPINDYTTLHNKGRANMSSEGTKPVMGIGSGTPAR